jgi:hypothetical protein
MGMACSAPFGFSRRSPWFSFSWSATDQAGAWTDGAGQVPRWASRGLIVFKCGDLLCRLRPGGKSGGVLIGRPRRTPWPQWDPALSTNGRSLAFRGYYQPFAEGDYAVHVLNIRCGTWLRVTRKGSGTSDPSWSPDSRWIAYTSGGGEIWKVRASGGRPVRLTRRHGVGDSLPAWSPDGLRITFVRIEHERGQVWVMSPNGS